MQADIEKLVNGGITFADIFDAVKPEKSAPFCLDGYTSINAGQADANHECLRVKVRERSTLYACRTVFGLLV